MGNNLALIVQGYVACYRGTDNKIGKRRIDLACAEKVYELVNYDDGLAKTWMDKYRELKIDP